MRLCAPGRVVGKISRAAALRCVEVPALTISGHMTIYRYQPSGPPDGPASFGICLVVGMENSVKRRSVLLMLSREI
jgi:hypothetical protein